MRLKKNDITKAILWLVLFIYNFLSLTAPHTIYSKLSLLLFVCYTFILIVVNKKISINYYFIMYLFFVLFIFVLNENGFYVDSSVVSSSINTILLNILFLFCFYNVLRIEEDISFFKNIYILSSALSLFVIMILCRNSLFTSRLAHAWGQGAVSYYFLGQPVAMSSNLIGFFCLISCCIL